jgi:hypothetical protein
MATVGGNSYGSYAANEQYNNHFFNRTFATDPGGNAYRCMRNAVDCDPTLSGVADLVWHGADYAIAVYTNAYFKENNTRQNDWSDVLDLIAVLNSENGYAPSNYARDVTNRVNVDQWMRYMAINALLNNEETCLATGIGDDYALYCGPKDPRIQVLPYDLDSIMGRGTTTFPPPYSIFRMTAVPAMDRFMKTPEFVPLYFRWLKEFSETSFAPEQMNELIDRTLGGFVPQDVRDTMKTYNAARVAQVMSQVPLTLTISNGLPIVNGYPRSDLPTVTLSGTANAIETRAVRVNGQAANWIAWQGTWSASVDLKPGINRVTAQALDEIGKECASQVVELWYDDGSVINAGGTLNANTTWSAQAGPYLVNSSLTIADGAILTNEPGTKVFLAPGADIIVQSAGQLLAEGTEAAPIWFGSTPGTTSPWGGLTISGAANSPETRLSYVYLVGNGTTCIEVAGGTVHLDHLTFGTTTHQYLALDGASFDVSHCHFPSASTALELVHGTLGIKAGGRGIIRRCFFGQTMGYSDVIDFTGGNRPGPILQVYNNVFSGGSDDHLDLDGTDAWVEGNIFLHVHRMEPQIPRAQ